jgi:hypothetical protein
LIVTIAVVFDIKKVQSHHRMFLSCFLALMQLTSSLNETMDNVENVHPPTESMVVNTSLPLTSTGDKRSIDEHDELHLSKRLRSSSSHTSQSPTSINTTTAMIKWVPPSKHSVTRLQSQSSSLFQFILSLIHMILTSIDHQLTDEHSRWLHSTVNLYGHHYNRDKINLLIETACKVAKINFVR